MYLEYFETTADDFMENCNWDKLFREKMRHPVAESSRELFKPAQARLMVDIAWFDDPHRPEELFVWDEAAKTKMREPVRTNGYHHLDHDEMVRKLLMFS